MKALKIIGVLLLAGVLVAACSETNRTVGEVDQSQEQVQKQPIQQAVEESQEGPAELAGMVMETEKGVSLVTDSDTYLVTGQDLSGMIGKRIRVTGTIMSMEDAQVLEVMSVMPLE